ncbi:MAG: hypothetical protein II794_06005, partial [Oscillospiraceae bacterium]|nr:hypothetical protein [Oscillospiraceae bacterium]
MKKLIALLLALAMVLSLAACSGGTQPQGGGTDNPGQGQTPDPAPNTNPEPNPNPNPNPNPDPTPDPNPNPNPNPNPDPQPDPEPQKQIRQEIKDAVEKYEQAVDQLVSAAKEYADKPTRDLLGKWTEVFAQVGEISESLAGFDEKTLTADEKALISEAGERMQKKLDEMPDISYIEPIVTYTDYPLAAKVLEDNESYKITLLGGAHGDDGSAVFRFELQNKTKDRELDFTVERSTVMDWVVSPWLSEELQPGETKGDVELRFWPGELEAQTIESVDELTFNFHVVSYLEGDAEELQDNYYTIYPTGMEKDKIQAPTRETLEGEAFLINTDDVFLVLYAPEVTPFGTSLRFFAENCTKDKDLLISIENIAVNGWKSDSGNVMSIPAGKRMYDSFYLSGLDELGITSCDRLDLHVQVEDSDNWSEGAIVSQDFALFPTGKAPEEVAVPARPTGENEVTVEETDDFAFIILSYGKDSVFEDGYNYNLYVKNKTDRLLYFSMEDVYLQEASLGYYWGESLPAGIQKLSNIYFDLPYMAQEYGVTAVTPMKFTLYVRESDEWNAVPVFERAYTFGLDETGKPQLTAEPIKEIRPEIRQMVKLVEDAVDELVAVSWQYAEDPGSGELFMKYLEVLSKLAEASEGFDEIDEESLTPDERAFVEEAGARIEARMDEMPELDFSGPELDYTEIDMEPLVLAEGEGYKVTMLSGTYGTDGSAVFRFSLENRTKDKDLSFQANDIAINGWAVGGWLYESVSAGETIESELEIYPDSRPNPGSLDKLQFTFKVSDPWDWENEDLLNREFVLYPTGTDPETFTVPERETVEGETVLLDEAGYKMVLYPAEVSFWGTESYKVYVENNSDRAVEFAIKNVIVNGWLGDSEFSAQCAPGLRLYGTLYAPDLTEAGVTSCDRLELDYTVTDAELWTDPPTVLGHKVLYPTGMDPEDVVVPARPVYDSEITLLDTDQCTFILLKAQPNEIFTDS